MLEFIPFPKIPRYSRPVIITEKIDGTNAQVAIDDNGNVYAGSRNRWLTPEQDNFGFAQWVKRNENDLRQLGPGRHFGEWWGAGVQRRYGLTEKRFSLFHSARVQPGMTPGTDLPACCGIVPTLYQGEMTEPERFVELLRSGGSVAVPGWMQPEGIVVYHTASGQLFKKLLENDNRPKGESQ